MRLIGHLCSKEDRHLMGRKGDLCRSQGRVLGWAVEGLHGLREEAHYSTKKPFMLQNQKTLVSLMETSWQIRHCVKQQSLDVFWAWIECCRKCSRLKTFPEVPRGFFPFFSGKQGRWSPVRGISTAFSYVLVTFLSCWLFWKQRWLTQHLPRIKHLARSKIESCNLHYHQPIIHFKWVVRECNHIRPCFFISEEKH